MPSVLFWLVPCEGNSPGQWLQSIHHQYLVIVYKIYTSHSYISFLSNFTLQGQTEIDKIETTAGEFPFRFVVFLPQTQRCRPRSLFDGSVAPQVRSAVSVWDIEKGDALQGRTVGKVERDSVTLRKHWKLREAFDTSTECSKSFKFHVP